MITATCRESEQQCFHPTTWAVYCAYVQQPDEESTNTTVQTKSLKTIKQGETAHNIWQTIYN